MLFEPKRLIRIPDSKILEEIQRVVKVNSGVVPTATQFPRLANMSIATLRDRFGSYAQAVQRAGFVYVPVRATYASERVLSDLRKVLEHTAGHRFSFQCYKQYGGVYALATIHNSLGTARWEEVMSAIEAKDRTDVASVKKPAHRERRRADLTDDDLLREMNRVWQKVGRRPTIGQFTDESSIDPEAYRLRFGSWAKAIERHCGLFGARLQGRSGTRVTKGILADELRTVCSALAADLVTYQTYRDRGGTYSKGAFINHFGSWMNAVRAVGRVPGNERRYSKEELFGEMQRLWENLGQQPTWHEMLAEGNISPGAYKRAFGSWKRAVVAFCNDRNSTVAEPEPSVEVPGPAEPNSGLGGRTAPSADEREAGCMAGGALPKEEAVRPHPRHPSPKLRWQVFVRDNFRCRYCGRSQKSDGVKMDVDHIKPWIQGGPTTLDNLQLLCEECNLGKSDDPLRDCLEEPSDR